MKNIIAFSFMILILICSCNKVNNDYNISIKNTDLKNKILQFNEDAKHYTRKNTSNTVSVAFWRDNDEIRIGLYSSKKLKDQDYLGKTNLNKIVVYFYSNDESTYKDIIDIEFSSKQIKNTKDLSDVYTCFYVLKNGKLELISNK